MRTYYVLGTNASAARQFETYTEAEAYATTLARANTKSTFKVLQCIAHVRIKPLPVEIEVVSF